MGHTKFALKKTADQWGTKNQKVEGLREKQVSELK